MFHTLHLTKKPARFLTTVFFCTLCSLVGNPFISFPGVRARAMGGAFTGIADDASSMWYNPAGVATPGTEIIVEWSQALGSPDNTGLIEKNYTDRSGRLAVDALIADVENGNFGLAAYENRRDAAFLGAKRSLGQTSVGIFYYQPYTFDYFFPPQQTSATGTNTWGQLDEELHIFGLSLGRAMLQERVRLGATLEYVTLDFRDSTFFQSTTLGNETTWQAVNLRQADPSRGFSWSLGGLFELLPETYSKKRGVYLRGGGTYRAGSDVELSDDLKDTSLGNAVAPLLMNKPESWDLGLSLYVARTTRQKNGHALMLAVQHGRTDFGAANDQLTLNYQSNHLGAEYLISFPNGRHLAFHGGGYRAEAEQAGWPEVDSLTVGINYKFNNYSISGGHEWRTLETVSLQPREQHNLFTAAVNYHF